MIPYKTIFQVMQNHLKFKLIGRIILLMTLMFPLLLSAQNNKIDSLNTIIFSNEADSTRLKAMLSLTWHYTTIDFDKALQLADKGLALSQKVKNVDKEASFLNLLALVYDEQNYSFDTIIKTYHKALAIARTLDDEIFIADLQNNMANTYKRVGQYDKAFELYQNALEIAERRENNQAACRYLNNIAIIMKNRGDFENALIYYNKGLSFARKMNNKAYIAALANNIGLVYDELNRLDTALIYYKEALELKRALGNQYSLITTLSNIGNIYIQRSELNQAFSYISEAYSISEKLNYPYGKALALSNLADYSVAKKDYKKAINYSNDGLEAINVDGDVELKQAFHEILMESYKELGDYKNAFRYKNIYHVLEDSIYNIESEQRIDELETKYQVSKKESENEILKANERANKAFIRQQNWLVFATLVLIVLLSLLLLFIRKNNEKKRKYRENLEKSVTEKTAELKSLNQQLIERNIELERFYYAASHDMKEPLRSVVSFSTLLNRREKQNLSEDGKQYLEFIRQNAMQMNFLVNSIREFSNLNDNEVECVDLNTTLKAIEKDLQNDLSKNNSRLIYDKLPSLKGGKTQFFLLFKHLIDNGFRYNESEKPTVKVEYTEYPTRHYFKIIDNGMGIEAVYQDQIFSLFKRLHNREISQKAGMGLATCKKIVQSLNGTIIVESIINEGTTFVIDLPKSLNKD